MHRLAHVAAITGIPVWELRPDFPRDGVPEERLTDMERQLLVILVTRWWVQIRGDDEMQAEVGELEGILRKISGTDTVVVVRRMYPSGAAISD